MQQQVYESHVNNVDELKQRLHDVWHGVQQDIIDLTWLSASGDSD